MNMVQFHKIDSNNTAKVVHLGTIMMLLDFLLSWNIAIVLLS
jgi:hypothetical protein